MPENQPEEKENNRETEQSNDCHKHRSQVGGFCAFAVVSMVPIFRPEVFPEVNAILPAGDLRLTRTYAEKFAEEETHYRLLSPEHSGLSRKKAQGRAWRGIGPESTSFQKVENVSAWSLLWKTGGLQSTMPNQ
jgi:hypothetical protein